MEHIEDLILFILFILLGVVITLFVQSIELENNIVNEGHSEEYYQLVDSCEKDNFMESMECINKYVKSIYKFKQTPDNLNLTLTDIKTKGGDCRNYAYLYKDLGNSLGYDAQTIRIDVNETTAHRIALVVSQEGYVILDQNQIFEFEFGE